MVFTRYADKKLITRNLNEVSAKAARPTQFPFECVTREEALMERSVGQPATSERTFDAAFYAICYAEILPAGADPADHYHSVGWELGLNPNAFFSTRLYMAANRNTVDPELDPFQQFLQSKPGTQPFASPVFDPKFYVATNPDVRIDDSPITHYWSRGRYQGRSPNALFDVTFYRSQLGKSDRGVRDLLTHYLEFGWKEGLAPHPLFDPCFYCNQLDPADREVPPLVHYLEKGWRDGLSPHPLFDPEYYSANCADEIHGPPLVHYLKQTRWENTPHYLFSDSYYINAVAKSRLSGTAKDYRAGPPLLHYVSTGAREGVPPHPLFDVGYYKEMVERKTRDRKDRRSQLIDLERNPLRHYLETGVAAGLSPTPLFDSDFYRSQIAERVTGDPLRHYLSPDGFPIASPHPAIDLDYYSKRNSGFVPSELPLLLDFLMTPQEERVSTHPSFDPQFYLNANPDIRESGRCPIQHFIEHGLREGRQPNRLFTYPYAHRLCKIGSPQFWNPVDGYFRARANERTRVLFLGHDASRSGAPLVMLGLVRHVSANPDIECITVLGKGGPLVDEFVHESFTYVAVHDDRQFLEWNRHSPEFTHEMAEVADLLDENPPELVVCNSLESRHLADFFVSRGYGPLVSLIHEVADPYDSAQISRLLESSEMSIYVSDYQIGRMRKKIALDDDKSAIVQFGALDRWFGSGDKNLASRAVRTELGLPPTARIILGCGTMNFRKGIDVFADVACRVLAREDVQDIHFVWVGGGETHYDSAFYWAHKFVQDRGFDSNVHFVGEQSDTERYFLAADVFLLTSRADPYPCVVQEALACSLPIIAFEGLSGAAEAFKDSGVTVPFDAGAMANAAVELIDDELQRKKRGKKAKSLVSAANGFDDYSNQVFGTIQAVAPELSHDIVNFSVRPAHSDDNATSVFIAMESWDCSETSLFAEYVVAHLAKSGVDAELLFTRGPATVNWGDRGGRLPDAPFSFLYPKSNTAEHVGEELLRYLNMAGGMSIVIPFADPIVESLVAELPAHVATMGLFHGATGSLVEKAYEQSLQLDHIVSTSSEIREELIELNPRIKKKLSFISPKVDVSSSRFKEARALRSKRGKTDPIRIVCAGFGAGEVIAPASVVKLAKLLRDAQTPFFLTIFADAAEMSAIRALAPDFVRSDSFALVEWPAPEEIRSSLEAADLLLYLSDIGSSAIVVAEALAVGCVPILNQLEDTQSSGLRDCEAAHFVEKGNLRKLVDIIGDHQRTPKRLQRMSEAAFRFASKSLSDEEAMEAQLVDACKQALRARNDRESGRFPLRVRLESLLQTA